MVSANSKMISADSLYAPRGGGGSKSGGGGGVGGDNGGGAGQSSYPLQAF